MTAAIAAFAMLSALDPAPAATPQRERWISCDTVVTGDGRRIIVDNIAFVFFETDSAIITAQGAARIASFMAGFQAPLGCRAMIAGHADRAGPAAYNLRLSRRRAYAVAAYLRRRGFAGPIVVEWHGESRPLVETADGVREPQNRYVVVYVGQPRPQERRAR